MTKKGMPAVTQLFLRHDVVEPPADEKNLRPHPAATNILSAAPTDVSAADTASVTTVPRRAAPPTQLFTRMTRAHPPPTPNRPGALLTQFIHLDTTSRRGRRLTITGLAFAACVVIALLAWFGFRRTQFVVATQADEQYRAGHYEAAMQNYDRLLQFDGTNAHALLNRGFAHQKLGSHAQAVDDFGRYIGLYSADSAGYIARAASYQQLGKHSEAIADYTAAIGLNARNADLYASRASANADANQWQPAADDLTQAIGLQPARADLYEDRARAFVRLEQLDRARADLDQALNIQPDLASALLARGFLSDRLGNPQGIVDDLSRVIALQANTGADVYAKRGRGFQALGRHDEALRDFNQALAIDPTNTTARSGRIDIATAQQHYDAAIADYSTLIQHQPSSQLYIGRGLAHRALDELDAAQADFQQAIVVDPNNANGYIELGILQAQQGQAEQAQANLDRAIGLGTANARAFATRGRLFAEQNKPTEALINLTQALTLRPEDSPTRMVRARLFETQNQTAAALADLDQVLSTNNQQVDALLARARVYEQQGDAARALEDVRVVLAADPKQQAALVTQARLLQAQGDAAGAQASLEQLRALDPQNTVVALRQAKLLVEQNKVEEALAFIRTALGQGAPAAPLYEYAGQLRYDLGQYGRALANYNAALATQSENGRAHLGIGRSERQLGNTGAAVVAFQHYLRLAPDAPERAELEAWIAKWH